MTEKLPAHGSVALLSLVIFAVTVSVPAFAAPCDNQYVPGPLEGTGDKVLQCKENLLGQVDCEQLCSLGECARQNPVVTNDCRNVAKLFTNLQYDKETRSCTVDDVECVCRCANAGIGRGECGDGEINPGEECDPGNTALGASLRIEHPDATVELTRGECSTGGTCEGDCTCSEPAVCGNGVVETGEDCDPPGTLCTACDTTSCFSSVCTTACGCERAQ